MLKNNIIKTVLEKIFALGKDEKFLIVADNVKRELAEEFFIYAVNNNRNVKIILMPLLERSGQEPPKDVAEAMSDSEVILILTSKSLSHTEARRKATQRGARIASSPGVTAEILNRCVDLDYDELIRFHDWLRLIIADSKKIRVISASGTDVTFSVCNTRGRSEELLKNKRGAFSNLPTGEVDSGVKNAHGKIVIDGSMSGVGLLEEKIELEVVDNVAKIISDNEGSDKLKQVLDGVGPKAYKIAEFGIGTNPKAIISGNVLEDEKVKGTVHFALGNNLSYGGNNNVPVHLDGIVKKPTIIVDGKVLMEKGEFVKTF